MRRGEGARLDATRGQFSNKFSLLTKGGAQDRCTTPPAAEPTIGKSFWARMSGMWSAPCSRIQRYSDLFNTDLDECNGYGTKMRPRNHHVPLAESQHHIIDPTNPGGALDDGVEDRLHVRG